MLDSAARGLCVLAVAWLAAVPAFVWADGKHAANESAAKLDRAIGELKAEAEALGDLKVANSKFHFARPHPALKDLGPDAALPALERMLQPFARGEGQAYKDLY